MEDHGRNIMLGDLRPRMVEKAANESVEETHADAVPFTEIFAERWNGLAGVPSENFGITPPVAERRVETRREDEKPTNPKDAIGIDKIPYHLWPNTASVLGSLGLLEGMLKYGRSNWRDAGVRFTIYYDAAQRHMDKLKAGEDIDADSGLPHEAHILACWAIIVDAKAAGKFVDDRDYNGKGYLKLLTDSTPHVRRIKDKYKDRDPKHWTIVDNKDE